MAVKPFPKDNVGAELDTKVTNLTSTANAIHPASAGAKAAAAAALDQAQRELVNHYMTNGRLSAATILSTLT